MLRCSARLLLLLAAAGVLMCRAQQEQPAHGMEAPETGVSQALAQARAARLSDLRYALHYTLPLHGGTTAATETLRFRDGGKGDLAVDFRDGSLQSAELNGHALKTDLVNGHLVLPGEWLQAGENTLATSFTANVAPAGKAITRYTDKDDGNEYLYTLFVPMDASMALPCFDQPDLKGRFTLAVTHPAEWTVVGNTAGVAASPTEMMFAETRPISTYLFAFAAGPFERIAPSQPGEPALLVRRSQVARARAEAPEVQAMTASGVKWLSGYFQQPFPFPKYDLVLIPGFPFGGMEHAGATFLNEDGVLFRSTPTQSDYFRRDILVLHETTHQWFGDLVTMRWFDDLWLKEGFAQYMAYKAMAALKPETQPWKHFAEDIKPLAYGIDETQGTTPIFQNIPNLKDAKSAYGAIVYQKAPAILKQLNFRIGEDTFRDGLRFYLQRHAYANATWPDLIAAFTQAGAKDLPAWADAWVLRRGMPQIEASFTCADGRITQLELSQHDVLHDPFNWPISNEVLLGYPSSETRLRMDWSEPRTPVAAALGKPCPSYVFANGDDQAYGRFLFDAKSLKNVLTVNGGLDAEEFFGGNNPLRTQDAFLRSLLWNSFWEEVRTAKLNPQTYVSWAKEALSIEDDEPITRSLGAHSATALHAYLVDGARREEAIANTEAAVSNRMRHAPTLDLRIANFRTFTAIAETPAALEQVKQMLAGTLVVSGLTLKPLDRWNLVGHLIAMNDPEAHALLIAEQARDHSGEAQKYAYAAQAGAPDAALKARYFDEYLTSKSIQEDWITQSLRPFNSWNQQALTLPYLERALNALPNIKRNRKIFFLGAWLGSFIEGQSTPEAQRIVHGWLAQSGIDPDLRLKVLEQSDALDRTVLIRKTYPE